MLHRDEPGLVNAVLSCTQVLSITQVLLMFGPEYARACGVEALEPLGIYLPGDKNYPGKPLNSCQPPAALSLQMKPKTTSALGLLSCTSLLRLTGCEFACRGRL